jgi:hypothetical protein
MGYRITYYDLICRAAFGSGFTSANALLRRSVTGLRDMRRPRPERCPALEMGPLYAFADQRWRRISATSSVLVMGTPLILL